MLAIFLNFWLIRNDINLQTCMPDPHHSLKDIIRVHGKISHLAQEAHLSRGTLYKLMQGRGQAEIGTVLKLIHALGYDLTVTRRAQRTA